MSSQTGDESNRQCMFPGCCSVITHFPVLPSQIFTALSNPALATNRPSGENATWLTCFWCPVILATGFLGVALTENELAAWSGHRKSVWSSDAVMTASG